MLTILIKFMTESIIDKGTLSKISIQPTVNRYHAHDMISGDYDYTQKEYVVCTTTIHENRMKSNEFVTICESYKSFDEAKKYVETKLVENRK